MSLQKRADTDLLCSDFCHKVFCGITFSFQLRAVLDVKLALPAMQEWRHLQCEMCANTCYERLGRGGLCSTMCATSCNSWRSES